MTSSPGKPSEAPLADGDAPEQDGSEDPGVGLAFIRDSAMSARREAQRGDTAPPSPSAAEHVDLRGKSGIAKERQPEHKTCTEGAGEGATVSHVHGGTNNIK
ncbi:MAG: hypothetical protein JWN23_2269 [Rhodocyclales bacterium]|nr:hypothetical protein [Rhodocyclales bacterium]